MKSEFEKFIESNIVSTHENTALENSYSVCFNRMCGGCVLEDEKCSLFNLTLSELNELKHEYPEEFI